MDNYFKTLYQVLKLIEYASYNDIDIDSLLDINKLNITKRDLDIVIFNILTEKLVVNRIPAYHIVSGKGIEEDKLYNPQLTTLGYEFLAENTQMKKAYKFLKELKDFIPAL